VKKIIRFASLSLSGLALSLSAQVYAQDDISNLNELLEAVEENRIAESEAHLEREQRFQEQVDQREQMLEDIREQVAEEEQTNTELEQQFDENRQLLTERRAQLRDVRANLNELLGNIQGVAGDFQSIFADSLVSAQHPGRVEFLDSFIDRVASDTEQVRVDEIERFWYFMQQELVESGRVVQYQDEVGLPSGELEDRTITRIGSFNAI